MALGSTTKFKYGSENFPILFQDGRLQVYKNPSGEIFVEDMRDKGVEIRISLGQDGLTVTSQTGALTPWATNGLPAFLVRGKG